MTEPFIPRVWIHGDTVFIAHRYGGCYEGVRVGATGLDDPEEISVLPPDAIPLRPTRNPRSAPPWRPDPGGPGPDDSCSTCGAEPWEPCRVGCAFKTRRTYRGWRELPAPTALSRQVVAEIDELRREARRELPDDI